MVANNPILKQFRQIVIVIPSNAFLIIYLYLNLIYTLSIIRIESIFYPFFLRLDSEQYIFKKTNDKINLLLLVNREKGIILYILFSLSFFTIHRSMTSKLTKFNDYYRLLDVIDSTTNLPIKPVGVTYSGLQENIPIENKRFQQYSNITTVQAVLQQKEVKVIQQLGLIKKNKSTHKIILYTDIYPNHNITSHQKHDNIILIC